MDKREIKETADKVASDVFKRAAQKSGGGVQGQGSTSVDVSGDNNNFVFGGDININKRVVQRTKIQPGPEHISSHQAAALQNLVKKAAEVEVVAGMSSQAAYQKWWSMVKRRFDVASYREIPRDRGEEAITWLRQRIAMNRPKLRRRDNKNWRNEHYSAIWARARQLGYSKGDVYGIVYDKLGKRVSSLKQLGERNLKKLYNILMSQKP